MTGKLRRCTAAVLAAVLFCLPLCLQPVRAADSASERRTIRVGMPDTDAVGTDGGENSNVAFQKNYLQAVAEYANWDYVYVDAPWNECLAMLKSGDIDLLEDVSKTEEREAWYDYSAESMGTEMCYLFGAADTKLYYNDYEAFNGMTVGYEKGSTILDAFTEYGKENGFTFTAVPYESGAAMFRALDEGKVDTVIQTNFFETPAGHVVLGKCKPGPVYIATSKKNPAVKSELDSAMAQLFSFNPGFNTDLFSTFFADSVTESIGYTKEEAAYLAKKPVVDVDYETDWAPFEYEDSGQAAGITPDVIRAIGAETGIQFRFRLLSSTQSIYSSIGDKTDDRVMAVSYDYTWANDHGLYVTEPYVEGSVMCVTRTSDTEPKIAAVAAGGYLENQVKNAYPQLQFREYENFAGCMQALAENEADCVFLNYYQAGYYRSMTAYEDYSYLPVSDITQNIALGITKGSNPLLLGILSKALQHISSSTLQSILSENAVQRKTFSFSMLMKHYPLQMAAALGCLGIFAGLLIFFVVSANARKRQNVRLAAAKHEADTANLAKSEFLSRMSHDMRTPLNGIIGMTYLTEKMELPEEARNNLQKIDVSSKFLLSLINDVLDMSKAESGKIELHPEPYPPQVFYSYLDAVIRPLCAEKNLKLVVDDVSIGDVIPLMDELRMNQIYFNLFSNAVKYTPENGTITYRQRGKIEEDGKLAMQISVRDTGIGMSPEFQKIVFEPFTQESRIQNAEIKGTGLGLAIVKELVDAMGGTIRVESKQGEGTVFILDLKFACIHAAELPEKMKKEDSIAAQEEIFAGKHILLCEDHPLNQEIARAMLEEKKMKVEIAENGQRGLEIFSRSAIGYFDLILMDIHMPVMDGYEAARQIRSLERKDAKAVPILAMTADAFAEDVQKCLDAGMNGHLAKPIDPEILYKKILEIFR